jgi:hypothetical protein
MPFELTFKRPRLPFAGADSPRSIKLLEGGAAIFAAPHGTPYEGIDNRPHAATADALRKGNPSHRRTRSGPDHDRWR